MHRRTIEMLQRNLDYQRASLEGHRTHLSEMEERVENQKQLIEEQLKAVMELEEDLQDAQA